MSLTLLRTTRLRLSTTSYSSSSSSFASTSSLSKSSSYLRNFTSTTSNSTATKDWQTTIGGRSGIKNSKSIYTSKYSSLLEKKAAETGITVEELLLKNSEEIKLQEEISRREKAGIDGTVEAGNVEVVAGQVVRPLPSALSEKEEREKKERNSESGGVKVGSSSFSSF